MTPKSRDEAGQATCTERPSAVILIIDDDRDFSPALTRFLNRFGVNAIDVGRPIEVMTVARERRPALILLDLCLDGGPSTDTRTAEHVLKCLKLDPVTRAIPVIAMSGIHQAPAVEARFRTLGAEAFYIKAEVLTTGPFLRSLQARLLMSAAAASVPGASLVRVDEAGDSASLSAAGFPFELTILVIDDEEDTALLLKHLLKGQRVLWADTGAKGLGLAKSELPDLVIVDLNMPGLDGVQVCERLRANDTNNLYLPILMHTGDQRYQKEVECLDIGADDYVIKNGSNARLLAKMRALIRRRRYRTDAAWVHSIGGVTVDLKLHTLGVKRDGAMVSLTKAEAAIILLLMSAEGALFDTKALHKKICRAWPNLNSTAIKTHVSHIRQKLDPFSRLIESVKGEDGYRFNVELAKTLI
jgi:DNA-binding response OmpR family regulator